MIDNKLKLCREELGMTQEVLGKVLGVSRKSISGWETANDCIPFDKLIKFCNLYDYSIDYVLNLSNKNIKYNKVSINKRDIGNRLKSLRNSLGLSQLRFASKCGISQTTYSHYETGLNLITTMNAYAIARTYGVSIDYLVGKEKRTI